MRRYFLIRNCFFIIRKSYIPLGYKCREIVFNILRCIIGVSISKDKVGYLKFIYSAIRDGVLGRFGPFVKSTNYKSESKMKKIVHLQLLPLLSGVQRVCLDELGSDWKVLNLIDI